MSGHGMLKYFCPITHKKDAPEDQDPPEGRSYAIYLGHIYRKLYPHRQRDQLLSV